MQNKNEHIMQEHSRGGEIKYRILLLNCSTNLREKGRNEKKKERYYIYHLPYRFIN